MTRSTTLAVILAVLMGPWSATPARAEAPWVATRVLSFELAQRLAAAAAAECRERGYQVAAAVADRSGRLLAFVRDPLAGPHTIDVSQRKAYAAATYQTPTSEMAAREELRATPGVFLVGGGVPIAVGGHFYGAVGVSGAPAEETPGDVDEACARAGVEAVREALEFGG